VGDVTGRALDDVERERWLGSPLVGDAAAEAHSVLPVARVAARVGAGAGTGDVGASGRVGDVGDPRDRPPREVLSLDGEWMLRGAAPAQEFSIDRWAAGRRVADPVTWWREGTDRSGWTRVQVPGTVQGQLVAAGEIPDPLLHDHTYAELAEHGVPEEWPWHFRRTRIEQQEWWYARTFDVPAGWRGREVRLVFEGIDYAATVYVNGAPVSRHEGMFGGPEVPVGDVLRFGERNEVVVRISPPPRDWHGVMKASPGWGWHYGHLISIGIWKPVRLEVVPEVDLRHVFVSTLALDADRGRAQVRVRGDLHWPGDADARLRLDGVIEAPDGGVAERFGLDVPVRPGANRFETELELEDVLAWWPFGHGEQPLYRAVLAAADGGPAVAATFGIRTVEMAALPDWAGEEYYRWRFVVNGRPLFVTGANWCWTDPMATRGFDVDEHLLRLAVHGNLTMLRAWGGGIVESDAFYDACDRLGILVYQEFPLNFGLPDASVTDLGVLDRQATRIVERLRNHPSLVMWGGGNENPEMPVGDDAMLVAGRRVSLLDDTRPFHRSDPWGGSAHEYGPYHEGKRIDEGYLAVDTAFFGEYGLSSQSDLASMARFLDPALLDAWPPPEHGAILQHQSQFSRFDLFKQLRYADYGPVASWAQMVEYSQVAQGEALRFASELMRAGSGTHSGGYWFYKLGEVFPGASWAVVDYYGSPKLSYYLARRFSRPVSAFATYRSTDATPSSPVEATVHVANDSPNPLAGARVRARLWDAELRVVAEQTDVVEVPAGGRVEPFTLHHDPADDRVLLLEVALEGGPAGSEVAQWYWFNAHDKTDAVRQIEAEPIDDLWQADADRLFGPYAEPKRAPLLELPRTRLEARLEPVPGPTDRAELVIRNAGELPAPIVLVEGFPHGPGRLLEDNAFGLRAGEERRIALQAPVGELGRLSVRAWNADAVDAAASVSKDDAR
jgi:hypothetical protein